MVEDILIEKYRPQNVDNIVGQDKIIKKLKDYVISKNMPHCMFAGPPGSGKTTSAICLAKELYGKGWKADFKELNGSNERGIDVIRGVVKDFAGVTSMSDVGFKIILLDEADNLTKDAQAALRRTMEQYSSSCRFILTCNYSSSIIEPIQSRCAVFRFKRISDKDIKERLKWICGNEGIKIENDALEAIAFVSEGDLRKSIGILDSCRMSDIETIKVCDIYDIVGMIEPVILKELIKKALSREFFGSLNLVEKVMLDGLSAIDILKGMMKEVMNMNIEDKMKVDIVSSVGECEFRISEGANELIQLKALIANIVKMGSLL